MLAQFPTVNKVLLTARTFVSVSMMKRFVILETLRGAETIFVFHEVKIDVTLGGGNYSSLKSIIFSSSSPTLFFLLFTSLLPPFSQYQKMGGTWEEHGRNVFVSPSLLLSFPIDTKAKFYRRQSEVLSKTYRTSIEHLSKTYRTPIEESMCQLFYPPPQGLSDAQKNGHIAKYLLFDK